MRTLQSLVACAVVAGLLAALSAGVSQAQPAPAPANLLPNPGFEETDAAGAPKGWLVSTWGGKGKDGADAKGGTARIGPADGAHAGQKALKARWIDGSTNIVIHPAEAVALKGKEKFRLTFWFKGPKDVTVYASMLTRNAQNPQIDYQHSKAVKASEEWQQTIFEFSNSPEAEKLTVYLRVDGDGVLFDDVSLERITRP